MLLLSVALANASVLAFPPPSTCEGTWQSPRTTPLTLFGGVRDTTNQGWPVDGLTLGARIATTSPLSIEIGGAASLPGSTLHGNLEAVLLEIAYQGGAESFQMPSTVEIATLNVLADYSFILQKGRWSGGPHVQAGLAGLLRADTFGTRDDSGATWTDPTYRLVPALAGSAAVEAWYAERLGLRLRLLDHLFVEPSPDYGARDGFGEPLPRTNRITSSVVSTLDLMVRL